MDNKIREIFNKILMDHYIKKNKVGLWIMEGKSEGSFVAISDEEPVEYQLFFYKEKEDGVTEKEWKVFFHEMAHIIDFEELVNTKGSANARKIIKEYLVEVEKINMLPKEKRQEAYKKLGLERQANKNGERMYMQMKGEKLI